VDVLRHHHETIDEQSILLARRIQRFDEEIPGRRCVEFRLVVITAEGKGVVLTGLLEVLQAPGHSTNLLPVALSDL
jgi:hypothetical protein